jgi:hypothetical protein
MSEPASPHDQRIAEAVRAACVKTAQQSYEHAAADGLCDEGAWEVAIDALRSLDVAAILREVNTGKDKSIHE